MLLRTVVKDCLFVNWAMPREALPALAGDLRYELHSWAGAQYGFVSALLFRQSGLRFSSLPWLRVSHPQLNLRFYVVDAEGAPAVLFHALIVPGWVVPLARATGQKSLAPGRFRYPRPSRDSAAAAWTWRAAARGRLEVVASAGPPEIGVGPDLGSWSRCCDYFRRRDRGYIAVGGRLRRVETAHSSLAVWPMRLEVGEHSLLDSILGRDPAVPWPEPHSSWLCPDMPLDFVLGGTVDARLPSQVPAPG